MLKLLTVLLIGIMSASAHADDGKPKPAKVVFGAMAKAAPIEARSIGGYARGCLAGGKMLPVNGPAWQAMRLSRNRNWGHPALVSYVERLAVDAKAHGEWPGLLVGDLAQPWGGPMLTGHASHQIGLDADIWLIPMPDRLLTEKEREEISAVSMLGADKISVNPKAWTPQHVALLKRAASYAEVARIFVHPAIKKALCGAAGEDRAWLSKVRPWWGHHYHFHVRLDCPPGNRTCVPQRAPENDDGCGKELDLWFKKLTAPPRPKPKKPAKPKPPLMLSDMPKECVQLVGTADDYLAEPPPDNVPLQPIPAAQKASIGPVQGDSEAAADD